MRPHVAELSRLAGTYVACHPNAGLPNAFGGYDQTPEETGGAARRVRQARAWSTSSAAAAARRPAHIAQIAAAVAGLPPRQVPAPAARTRFSGLEPFEIGPDTGFVMIGERTNVTGSARFRRLIEADDHQAAVDVALEQVRGGANLLDVNMDADLLDSEQAMTTFLNLIATEPEVARIPIMIDSSRWSVLEAGLKCVQGKGVVNSISLKEGEEPFLEQARRHPRLRRRRGRHGLRRAGPGRHRRAQGVDLRPRLRPADPAGRVRGRGHRVRPERARRRHRHRRAQRLRQGVHRGAAADQAALPGRAHQRRHLQPVVLLPRQRRRARGDALGVPAPRRARRPGHGHRQRRPARGLPGHPGRPARTRRGRALRPARRTPPTGWSRSPRRSAGRGTRRVVDLSWREAPVEERLSYALVHGIVDFIEADTEEARQLRRTPARRDRGPADGRHEDRRRPVRRGQDVPAAGGQERPGDEALGRLPRAVHGGGEGAGAAGGAPRHRPRPGQGRAGHRQGRRARHRQEHRRRRARLQQLRGHRPRRDGAGRRDPGHRDRRGRRRRRAVRADHPVAGRDGHRRRRRCSAAA